MKRIQTNRRDMLVERSKRIPHFIDAFLSRWQFRACLFACLWTGCHIALACRICVPSSTESPVDYLLFAETVVLARENPDKPFALIPIEVIKGTVDGGIPLFIDSVTRHTLMSSPERSIILVEQKTWGGRKWKAVGIADAPFAQIVRDVLKSKSIWLEQPRKRLEYFNECLNRMELNIRQLAYL